MMTLYLFIGAITLGLLAFFEPCTIATHTLLSVRLNQEKNIGFQKLFSMWLSRSVLLIGLFIIAVSLFDSPEWGKYLPSIVLSVMAFVYLISRLIYLPIPHLAFYKLLPFIKKLPMELQLGLTLPACTIPLVIIIAAMTVTVNSLAAAISAGLLFATAFTLPMFVTTSLGLNDKGKHLLSLSANISPYLTAFLLLGFATYLVLPDLEIITAVFESNIQAASWAGLGIAFFTGFVFSFNPVAFASVPVMLAYVTKGHEQKNTLLLAGAFIIGTFVTHLVLGVAAALGGEWVQDVMGRQWAMILGPLLIVMGLLWTGLLNIRVPWFGMKAHKVTDIWGAFLLGIPFSIAVCPFCTPALMVALTASAAIGSVGFGAALLLAFAIGRSIPIALGAWGMNRLESLNILARYQKLFEILGGSVLILTGLFLVKEYYSLMDF